MVGGTQGRILFFSCHKHLFSLVIYSLKLISGLAYFMNVHRFNLTPGEWEPLYVIPPDFELPGEPTPRYLMLIDK